MEGFLQEKLCWWKPSTVDCASSQGKPGLELRQDGREESKPPLLLHLYPGDMGGDFFFFAHSFYERMMTCFRLLKRPLISNGDRSLSAFVRQDLDLFSLPSRSASDFSKNNPPHHKSLLATKGWVWMWQKTVGEPSHSKIDPNSQLVPPLPWEGDAEIGAGSRGTFCACSVTLPWQNTSRLACPIYQPIQPC